MAKAKAEPTRKKHSPELVQRIKRRAESLFMTSMSICASQDAGKLPACDFQFDNQSPSVQSIIKAALEAAEEMELALDTYKGPQVSE
jgi:phosphotransacetylase